LYKTNPHILKGVALPISRSCSPFGLTTHDGAGTVGNALGGGAVGHTVAVGFADNLLSGAVGHTVAVGFADNLLSGLLVLRLEGAAAVAVLLRCLNNDGLFGANSVASSAHDAATSEAILERLSGRVR